MKESTATFGTIATVGICIAIVGVSASIFAEAASIKTARAALTEVDLAALDAYHAEQAPLLNSAEWADDRALGGAAGESKRAQLLKFKRKPLSQAKAEVLAGLKAGTFQPVALSPEQTAALDKMSTGGVTAESLAAATQSPEMIAQGKAEFGVSCVACHGPMANGLVGPNLTDEYVINGRQPMDVYKVLTNGVVAKGMPPWGHLGPEKLAGLTAYVTSLIGTNVEGKAPQGVDAAGNAAPTP